MKTITVCPNCGSSRVWRAAQVNVNTDETTTLDDMECGRCGYDGRGFNEVEVADNFDVCDGVYPAAWLVDWAVGRWEAEVKKLPLMNGCRRPLDSIWRRVIRFAGGDPDKLIGPDHDTLMDAWAEKEPE